MGRIKHRWWQCVGGLLVRFALILRVARVRCLTLAQNQRRYQVESTDAIRWPWSNCILLSSSMFISLLLILPLHIFSRIRSKRYWFQVRICHQQRPGSSFKRISHSFRLYGWQSRIDYYPHPWMDLRSQFYTGGRESWHVQMENFLPSSLLTKQRSGTEKHRLLCSKYSQLSIDPFSSKNRLYYISNESCKFSLKN